MTRLLVIVALVLTLTAIDALAQNVAQVDSTGGSGCSNTVLSDIPGLALSLTTTGNPVLIIYTVAFIASPTGVISIVPVIDGVNETLGVRARAIGDFSGQWADVTFSRVYALAGGAHTFGLRAICQSGVAFTPSWLTVYELPQGKHENKGHD